MHNHLMEYASKYSVYNEIIIFDTQGNVQINMNRDNLIQKSTDPIIEDALNTNDYVEKYSTTDIFASQEKTLVYAQKIRHNSQNIGVLCLCFKFEDELESIFKNLSHNNEILSISGNLGILATNQKSSKNIPIKFEDKKYTIVNKKYVSVSKQTSGYQGYSGISDWYATAMQDTIELVKENVNVANKDKKNLLNQELNDIIEKANDIIDDIADVIINGELIACKQKVYLLTPILDNMRSISTELLSSIKDSIRNLEVVVEEGLIHDAKMASHLAIDIMDRSLYERANDSRWWALTPLFEDELFSDTPDSTKLNATLKYINDLYTVYTNIFIYDKNKKVIASSTDSSIIGNTLSQEYLEKTLFNTNTQNYYVSDFENSSLYRDKATYIYSATIKKSSAVVGGIGVVFDSEVEFREMLNDSFPSSKKGFMVFIDKDKRIISTNHSSLKILDILDIDEKFVALKDAHSIYDYLTYDDKEYIVASVSSQGYREYKTKDNYVNATFCLTFIEI
ncbi:MAG: cache domain-containing protein [Sulfurimonas sp.]|nr:cache domain-containing protein [Sulfurimonas sp.]